MCVCVCFQELTDVYLDQGYGLFAHFGQQSTVNDVVCYDTSSYNGMAQVPELLVTRDGAA
jgi:hypothetical protein